MKVLQLRWPREKFVSGYFGKSEQSQIKNTIMLIFIRT